MSIAVCIGHLKLHNRLKDDVDFKQLEWNVTIYRDIPYPLFEIYMRKNWS